MRPIDLREFKSIFVLTGAGISAGSGLRTFRGPNGLWDEMDAERMSTLEGLREDPRAVWNFYGGLRDVAAKAQPNAAHVHLAKAETALAPSTRLQVVTQNVDGLHQRAGSRNVLELHGNAFRSRCMDDHCAGRRTIDDSASHDEQLPACSVCGGVMRPDVTFFGEPVSLHAGWTAKRVLRDCDLFLAIGTSGTVSPAAEFVRGADYAGAKTVFINLEPMPQPNGYFHAEVLGRAEEVLPQLLRF
jgi:NAD-dependent deacetylase